MWNLKLHQPPNSRTVRSFWQIPCIKQPPFFWGKRTWHHYNIHLYSVWSHVMLKIIWVHVVNLHPSSLTSASWNAHTVSFKASIRCWRFTYDTEVSIHSKGLNPLYPLSCPASLAVNTSKCFVLTTGFPYVSLGLFPQLAHVPTNVSDWLKNVPRFCKGLLLWGLEKVSNNTEFPWFSIVIDV